MATTEPTNGSLNVPSPALPSDLPMMADSPQPQPPPVVEQALPPAPPVVEQQQPQPTVTPTPLPLMATAVPAVISSANVSNFLTSSIVF